MIRLLASHAFAQFDRSALDAEEREVLDGGATKHTAVLRAAAVFTPFQILLAVVAPEIAILLSSISFVSLMLGSAWYNISFQNVSMAQLVAGVADFITKKMFRGFVLSFNMLMIGTITFVVKMMIPELVVPGMMDIFLWLRLLILIGNLIWLLLVWSDVYFASVAYDAADSLLGDGFPTLMRGARANAENLEALTILKQMVALQVAMAEEQGVDVSHIVSEEAPSGSATVD